MIATSRAARNTPAVPKGGESVANRPSGFIMFTDDLDKTKRLSDADFREWLTACLVYAETGQILDLPDMAALCFDFVKSRIDKDVETYSRKCEVNRENGKKGGRPPKPKLTQQYPVGFSETEENPQNPNLNLNCNLNQNIQPITQKA